MEVNEKLEKLEDEFKIMKVELKETLTNVRDFLLFVRPLPGNSGAIFQSDDEDYQLFETDTVPPVSNEDIPDFEDSSLDIGDMPELEIPSIDIESDVPEPEMVSPDMADGVPEPEMFDEPPENEPGQFTDSEEILSEAESQDKIPLDNTLSLEEGGNMGEREGGTHQGNPQVNLLANLVHWISAAKKDIGSDRLPGFLEVYGISRRLPSGLKEYILHLADTVEEPAGETSLADAWTRLTLELHGILAGGTPFHSPEAFIDAMNKETHHSNNGDNDPESIKETIIVNHLDY